MINFEDVIHRDNKALITQSDINTILNSGEPFVTFHVSVANSGHSVQFTTDFEPILDEDWNGYDFNMTIEEFEEKLEDYGVIMEIGGKLEFMWEVA
jgi:hypothetical protein